MKIPRALGRSVSAVAAAGAAALGAHPLRLLPVLRRVLGTGCQRDGERRARRGQKRSQRFTPLQRPERGSWFGTWLVHAPKISNTACHPESPNGDMSRDESRE